MSVVEVEFGAEYPSASAEDFEERNGYLVVVERGARGFGAYVPDLPGVVAAADSEPDVLTLIEEALQLHLDGLRAEGETPPPPVSSGMWVRS